jgi:tRNA(fMet)-specific endonuclease VapC
MSSSRVQENMKRLDEFARTMIVLPCDSATSTCYAAVKFDLRQKGRPIPENDVWIAAIARQYGLRLISRDAHFEKVDGLDLDLV